MACTITSRISASVEDKRVTLSNANFGRTWTSALGTNWQKIRVGIRFGFTTNGVDITGTPKFFVGACSGTGGLFQDVTSSNCIGLVSTTATWAWLAGNASSPARVGSGPAFYACTRISNSFVTSSGNVIPNHYIMDTTWYSGSWNALYVDINKNSGSEFVVNAFGRTNPSAPFFLDQATFINQGEVTTPVLTNYAFGTQRNMAFSESSGSLDSVCIAWDRTTPVCEISDLIVVKLS